MRAVLLREVGRLEVAEVPVPPLGPDQVMVRVAACGICGSDLRYLHGENPWAQHTLGLVKPNPPNMILGHELSGTVSAAGSPAWQHLVGQRVAVLSFRGCGHCFWCQAGQVNLCPETQHLGHGAGWQGLPYNPGGMAEYCPIWADHTYPLPEHISPHEATLLDGAGVAVHAVNRGLPGPGERVAVFGCGVIGLLIAQVALAQGAAEAFAIDISSKQLELAQQFGARPLDARRADVVREVLEASGGVGVGAVFNTVGSEQSFHQSLRMLRRGGRLVQLAAGVGEMRLPMHLMAGERTIVVSANNLYPEYEEGLRLLSEGKIKAAPMVTHVFPLAEALAAFQVAEHKGEHGAIKVVLEP